MNKSKLSRNRSSQISIKKKLKRSSRKENFRAVRPKRKESRKR